MLDCINMLDRDTGRVGPNRRPPTDAPATLPRLGVYGGIKDIEARVSYRRGCRYRRDDKAARRADG